MTAQGDGGTPPAPAGYVPPSLPGVAAGSFSGIFRGRLVIVSGPSGAIVGVFVYQAGTIPALGNPPIFWATSSSADQYGNAIPSTSGLAGTGSFQVGGPSATAMVDLVPGIAGPSKVTFPIPSLSLSNVANMASGPILSTYSGLVVSGPAMTGALQDDWVQIIMYSNDTAGTLARGELRYIDVSGTVHTLLDWGKSDQAIHIPAGGGPFISGESFHSVSLPGSGGFSGTIRVKKLPWNMVALDFALSWTNTAGGTFTAGSLPDSTYYPVVSTPRRYAMGTGGTPSGDAQAGFIVPASGALSVFVNASVAGNPAFASGSFEYPTN